jgi:Flp pilus assembly protein TadG
MSKSLIASGWRAFLRDEGGQELAEFALVLTAFSILAMGAFAIISAIASGQMNAQQSSLDNAAVNAETI